MINLLVQTSFLALIGKVTLQCYQRGKSTLTVTIAAVFRYFFNSLEEIYHTPAELENL